jgi:hypothetical protein
MLRNTTHIQKEDSGYNKKNTMKKTIIILFAALLALAAQAQKTMPQITLTDTVRADGQKFIMKYPVGAVTFNLVDSMKVVNVVGGNGSITTTMAVPVDGYLSVNDSKLVMTVKKTRIVANDTLITYPTIVFPLSAMTTQINSFMNGAIIKGLMKPTAREWVKAKLKDN